MDFGYITSFKNIDKGFTKIGLRPLAVGTVLRRLASILVPRKALPFTAEYLLPHQVSAVAGAETDILVHGFREKLQQFEHDRGKVALRVDAANAFNAVSRSEILETVCEQALPADRFVHAMYGAGLHGGGYDAAVAAGNSAGRSSGHAAICAGYSTSCLSYTIGM
jgi:hypothetical protein